MNLEIVRGLGLTVLTLGIYYLACSDFSGVTERFISSVKRSVKSIAQGLIGLKRPKK